MTALTLLDEADGCLLERVQLEWVLLGGLVRRGLLHGMYTYIHMHSVGGMDTIEKGNNSINLFRAGSNEGHKKRARAPRD